MGHGWMVRLLRNGASVDDRRRSCARKRLSQRRLVERRAVAPTGGMGLLGSQLEKCGRSSCLPLLLLSFFLALEVAKRRCGGDTALAVHLKSIRDWDRGTQPKVLQAMSIEDFAERSLMQAPQIAVEAIGCEGR